MSSHQRPRLERWSWIAGIVAAIIAAVSLYDTLRSSPASTESYNQTAGAGAVQIGKVNGTLTVNAAPKGPLTVLPMSHEIFWDAITRGDVANIERMLENGMRLKPEYLQDYFSRYYTPATFAALQRYTALPSAGCPVTPTALAFYETATGDVQRATAIRQVCGAKPIIVSLEQARDTVAATNAAATLALARFSATVTECKRREMRRRSVDQWFDAASRFMILSVDSYTLEQEILAKLNAALISSQVTPRNMREILAVTVDETCKRYNSPPKPNDQLLQRIDRVLRFLKAE